MKQIDFGNLTQDENLDVLTRAWEELTDEERIHFLVAWAKRDADEIGTVTELIACLEDVVADVD